MENIYEFNKHIESNGNQHSSKFEEMNDKVRREIRDRALGNRSTPTPQVKLTYEDVINFRTKLLEIADHLKSPAGDGHEDIFDLQKLLREKMPLYPSLAEDIEWVESYSVVCYQRLYSRIDLADQVMSLTESLTDLAEKMITEERNQLVRELKDAREELIQNPEFLEELFKNGVYSSPMGEMLTDAIMNARHPSRRTR